MTSFRTRKPGGGFLFLGVFCFIAGICGPDGRGIIMGIIFLALGVICIKTDWY